MEDEPLVLAIKSPGEISSIADRVSYESLAKLQAVDFDDFVVVALFRDFQLSTGYPVYIKRLVQRDGQLIVCAEFWSPPELSWQGMATTAPYHLVKIAKKQNLPNNLALVLQTELITPTPIEGGSLAFETVALNESGTNIDVNHMRDEIQLLLLLSSDDITFIQDQVNPETLLQLHNINFNEYVVIALFRGRKPSDNYQTMIERIFQKEDELAIQAQFWEPNPQWMSADAITSPYHLVKVARRHIPDLSKVKLTLHSIPITPTPPAR